MKRSVLVLLLLFSLIVTRGQDKISYDGYVSDMQSVMHIPAVGWLWQNQLQNRLNFDFYPDDRLTASIQVRSRFLTGSSALFFPGSGGDAGWLNLALSRDGSLNTENSFMWSVMIDRAWLELSLGNLVIKAGRQRINWGQTFVWNPNDLFNSYSFFDIDYPEKPGSDALLVQYYTGNASDIEVALKTDSSGAITAAGYFRFNAGGYDIQVLGGVLSGSDFVTGLGWSGSVSGASFRGEASYFRDLHNFRDSSGYLLFSSGLDYTTAKGLFLQCELLYSGFARSQSPETLMAYLADNLDVKKIGLAPWSIYAGASYPLSPLINGSLSAIVYPEWKGFYFGPSFEFSLSNNLYLSLIGQIFSLEQENAFSGINERVNFYFAFLRLKWNF